MNNKQVYIIITAGRGPLECSIAVRGIQEKFKAFLKKHGIEFNIVSQKLGSVAGSIETIVFQTPESALPHITPWLGTHKWVCQSPIRRFHKRKNWFVKCERIDIADNIQVDEKDVTTQTYRASGPGGQHRNKVETAVRLIHRPSGMVVTASDGKSQHQNRKKAWIKLREKIAQENMAKLQQLAVDQWSEQIEIERG